MQFVSAMVTEHTLPPALREYAASDEGMPKGTPAWVVIGIGALALLGGIASYVGMFMLRKWGRRCYVLSNVAGMAAATFLPPSIVSNISETIDWVSWIAVGKIIAVAYFTPLFDQAEDERMKMRANL